MFSQGDKVIYPAHGVACIDQVEQLRVGETSVLVFVLRIQRDRLTIRIPFNKINSLGIRHISSPEKIREALDIMAQPPQGQGGPKKTWSRRTQELTGKVQSGDLFILASVLRDLGYKGNLTSQSFGEHQIFYTSMTRFVEEWCQVESISPLEAETRVLTALAQTDLDPALLSG
jgi:CarD family transcriptional regulator